MPNPGSPLRLRWRPASQGQDNDFEARDGRDYCRVHVDPGGPQRGRWWWAAARGDHSHGTGVEDTARDAALAAEAAYFGPRVVETPSPFVADFIDPTAHRERPLERRSKPRR